MKKYGLIGYPIAHSQSPLLFREVYGDSLPYDLVETPDFEEAWDTFLKDYDAVNVTMPFKAQAAQRADIKSPTVLRTGAANILVKTQDGIAAYNSDYDAIKSILDGILSEDNSCRDTAVAGTGGAGRVRVTVIGSGGAGRAAAAAAEDCGMEVRVLHHDEVKGGVSSDIIVYTLPSAVEGIGAFRCRYIIEANYRDPALKGLDIRSEDGSPAIYIGGEEWLRRQADTGFAIMTRQDI